MEKVQIDGKNYRRFSGDHPFYEGIFCQTEKKSASGETESVGDGADRLVIFFGIYQLYLRKRIFLRYDSD